MTHEWSTHSGSRWEPLQPSDPSVAPSPLTAQAPRRHRRGPVLAALVALLTLGTTSAGVAYVRTNDGTVIDSPAQTTNDQPRPGDQDGRHSGAGHRGAGEAGWQRVDHGRSSDDQTGQRPGSPS